MSATPSAAQSAPRRKRAAKPNGQWKIDGRAPLNHNEEFKLEDDGLNVRERIESVYAREGFDAIADDDLHGRFRWWGLYTQRRPGIDGGRTAKLETSELEDRYFMMRVRIDGGALSLEQLRVIAGISEEFGRGTADVTDRQNIQLHWVQIEAVPEIWRRLESVGLSTTEACGDVSRVILGSPVAGVAAEEILDPTPTIREIKERFIGDPELSNLPRKFKTAVTGHPSQDVVHEINDISLVGVEHPELGAGYDLWVGGGLSTNAHLAQRLGAFVAPEHAAQVWHGVTSIFRDYGYRRLRNRARLKFLMADWGPERFREVLEEEYLGWHLPDGPAPQRPTRTGDHVGVHRQKDGRYYVGLSPVVGHVGGAMLNRLADLMQAHGSQRLRLTPYQKIVVLDVPEDDVEAFVAGAREIGLEAEPSLFRRTTMACTGIQFCKLAIVDTKDTAEGVIRDLDERLADVADRLPEQLTLHINGCPNSCARIQTADIGLKGQIITDEVGEQVPGFQVHLGGELSGYANDGGVTGRTVRGLKVPATGIADYVERLVRSYLRHRQDPEQGFADWARTADEEMVR
ncbi:sulfite reductase [Rothia kristinae]|uniref:assimilatory sulfite reductase (ferredoxin) n=1 Tax=Rothia kristinae TaxID=37923 RepID=A0A1S2MZ74_9MICC|nr:nitrite/sulfite reductase [Rothia kristinae]OIJ35664.1 sulfite reductase [Rothia kristinae]